MPKFIEGKNGGKLKLIDKGEPSPNPAGRPKGRNLSTILKEMLEEEVEVDVNGKREKKTLSDILIRKLITKASKGDGDVRAIEAIFDRVDGKPKENEGQPTEMIITVKRKE